MSQPYTLERGFIGTVAVLPGGRRGPEMPTDFWARTWAEHELGLIEIHRKAIDRKAAA